MSSMAEGRIGARIAGSIFSSSTNKSIREFEKEGPKKSIELLWIIRVVLFVPLLLSTYTVVTSEQTLVTFMYLLPILVFTIPSFISSITGNMFVVFRLVEVFSYILMITLLVGILIVMILDELLPHQVFFKHSVNPLGDPYIMISYLVAFVCIPISFFYCIQYLIKLTGTMYGFYNLVDRPKILGKDKDTMYGLTRHKKRFISVSYWKGILNFFLYIFFPSLIIWSYLVMI